MVHEAFISSVPETLTQLVFATLLGLFIGLEREWSDKPAGIRTFALVSLLGALFMVIGIELLVVTGAFFIIVLAALLGVKSFVTDVSGLSLTTSVSMLVSYGVGVLCGSGYYLEAVTVAVFSSLLLVLKRELHSFAGTLSKDEMKSAVEFAIIAFVVYPLLPTEQLGPWDAVEPRLVWLLVIAISGIGFANYVLVQEYDEKGFAFTGFFGGLVNSTAVVASMTDHGSLEDNSLAVSAVMLANGAMALRNEALILVFIPALGVPIGAPLIAITVAALVISYVISDWDAELEETELKTPFSLKRALSFGVFFLFIVIASAGAKEMFGDIGFLVTAFFSGFVSSGTVTTTAVTLVSTGKISPMLAAQGVLLGTISSIGVKVGFAYSVSRKFGRPVLLWSIVLAVVGTIATIIFTAFPVMG